MSCDCINAKTAITSGGLHKWLAVLNVILIVLSHGMTVISAAAVGVSSDTLRCPKMSCKMLLNPTALHLLKSCDFKGDTPFVQGGKTEFYM